jgi:response regulator of citrate/malate metabolism
MLAMLVPNLMKADKWVKPPEIEPKKKNKSRIRKPQGDQTCKNVENALSDVPIPTRTVAHKAGIAHSTANWYLVLLEQQGKVKRVGPSHRNGWVKP